MNYFLGSLTFTNTIMKKQKLLFTVIMQDVITLPGAAATHEGTAKNTYTVNFIMAAKTDVTIICT